MLFSYDFSSFSASSNVRKRTLIYVGDVQIYMTDAVRVDLKSKSGTVLQLKKRLYIFPCTFYIFCEKILQYIDVTLIGKTKLNVTDSDLIGRHTCSQELIGIEAFFVIGGKRNVSSGNASELV